MLNNYYEYYKTNELSSTLTSIKNNFEKDNFYETLENVAYNTDFCIEVVQDNNTIYSNVQNNKGCIDTSSNTRVLKRKLDFMNSDKEYFKLKIINPKFENMTLLYGVKLNSNNYVFLNTSLEPIETTVDILKSQLIIVTFIVIILAIVLIILIILL